LRLAAGKGRSLAIAELVGNVESDNVASIRCLLAAGFTQAEVDEFGPVFRLRLPDT
jgi:RimJ/RimL family protein N-acetyltransferase